MSGPTATAIQRLSLKEFPVVVRLVVILLKNIELEIVPSKTCASVETRTTNAAIKRPLQKFVSDNTASATLMVSGEQQENRVYSKFKS